LLSIFVLYEVVKLTNLSSTTEAKLPARELGTYDREIVRSENYTIRPTWSVGPELTLDMIEVLFEDIRSIPL
jgi:hypothetical protein